MANEYPNVDENEIIKFDKVAQIWWDPQGAMGTLHTINPLRLAFIKAKIEEGAVKILDVGCGGGILSEALARTGAQVTAIDLSRASLAVAQAHARLQDLQIDYRAECIEATAEKQAGYFDVVTCMEMLEHVPEPQKIVAACATVLKPGGHAFFSTINRTPKAFLFVILGGEYLLNLLPKGTHTYKKLIQPQELKTWANDSGLAFMGAVNLIYNPFNRKFRVASGKTDMNYMVHFIKL